MKPNISIYPMGAKDETKKFEGYISAAFWLGIDQAEGDLESVKVRQPVESYDSEVAALSEFTNLLVQRQINFSVEFFTEPGGPAPADQIEAELNPQGLAPEAVVGGDVDFEAELNRIKEEYQRGGVSKKQYEMKKGALLKRWREKVEGKLER